MPLLMRLLFYQCAILLVSFEGIVCPRPELLIKNFSTADIYTSVGVEGAMFVLRKTDHSVIGAEPLIVPFFNILAHTICQEGNNMKAVSFYVREQYYTNYNIVFKSPVQAHHFATHKALPKRFTIRYARIYSNMRPAIMTYDKLDDDDIGFKLLDNGDYPDQDERLDNLPYHFKRSEIDTRIRTRPPQTLYLRNRIREQDYMINFKSTNNLRTILNLFPDRAYDDSRTVGYYHMHRYEVPVAGREVRKQDE